MNKQIINLVDIETVELQLSGPDVAQETVDELYQFGHIVLADVRQRASWVESKLTTILGWSVGSLALLLASSSIMQNAFRVVLAALFLLCAIVASIALKTKMTAAISEKDWFQDSLMATPPKMKRYHVVSMLLCHQQYMNALGFKGECLKYAEFLLAIGAVCLALILFTR